MSKGKHKRKPRAGSYREAAFKQGVRTVKETVDVVSFVTGEPRSRVNQFARRLIDDGLLPKSIGRDVRKVGPEAAMLMIFAIGHATRTADVTSTAKEFMQLPLAAYYIDGWLLKSIRDNGVEHEPNVIDALKLLLNPTYEDHRLNSIGITKSSDGTPSVELKAVAERWPWNYSHGSETSWANRTYEIPFAGVLALRHLMWVPDLPDDPIDFEASLDAALYLDAASYDADKGSRDG